MAHGLNAGWITVTVDRESRTATVDTRVTVSDLLREPNRRRGNVARDLGWWSRPLGLAMLPYIHCLPASSRHRAVPGV